MKKLSILVLVILPFLAFSQTSFKEAQKKYPRVRQAYTDKLSSANQLLERHALELSKISIYLRAFKQEKEIELWARESASDNFKLIETYDICQTSGALGPKRKQGDLQIPEGFYHIDRFNPYSNFYLSLGLNYPNASDRILGVKDNLGGDIFIHGACVTIGCMPITNSEIKELYIICVEAKNNGQDKIPVTVFPARLNDANYNKLKETYASNSDKLNLWADLKRGYDIFNETKKLPNITFLNNGRHTLSRN